MDRKTDETLRRAVLFHKRMRSLQENKKSKNPIFLLERQLMERRLSNLFAKIYSSIYDLNCVAYVTKEPVKFENRESGIYISGKAPFKWSKEVFECAWMHITGNIPAGVPLDSIVVLADVGGEGLVYTAEGKVLQGITTQCSEFSYDLGRPMKKVVPIDNINKNGKIDFWIDAASNDLFGKYRNSGKVVEMCIAAVNNDIRDLFYDLHVLISIYDYNPDSKYNFEIFKKVKSILGKTALITADSAKEFRKELAPYLKAKNTDEVFSYTAVGHAHLDLAWLWPIRESKRKGGRTFANQLMNIAKYPEYIFGASQAQLYDWVKQEYPEVYQRVKEAVDAGRWELQGATWVEPDSNLISGESLIRQFLYGKKFYRKEFGANMEMFWVPDSFGYSACIPQVMALAGVKYFLTQKMSWNTVNDFPHHTFYWQGLDGTKVLAHMLPENTYNAPCHPITMTAGVKRYKEIKINQNAMMLFGIGDGGAGPGFEHLERLKRMENLKGLPTVKPGKAIDFFKNLESRNLPFPTYSGELYLERHQGTYTTRTQNKKMNRRTEFLLHNYELLSAFAVANGKQTNISSEELESIWKEVLLYQFHDILPGSSINRVYEECLPRYAAMSKALENAIAKLAGGRDALFNPTPFDQRTFVKIGNDWRLLELPKMGYQKVENSSPISEFKAKVGNDCLENDCVKVTFKDGAIAGIFDKATGQEYLSGKCVYSQYTDMGDCWDIRPVSYQWSRRDAVCASFGMSSDGPIAIAKSVFKVGDNVITQITSIADGSKLVSISVDIDCNQQRAMLRLALPTTIDTPQAAFNVQFGHIYRPTTEKDSIEKAQFEVSGQKFVDLSNENVGISLLNDCKYGYRVKGKTIDVDLVRSPFGGPGKNVDQGKQSVSLGLLPHSGKVGVETYRQAYYINNKPFYVSSINASLACYSTDNESIVAEYVKTAEDGSGDMIVRYYNSSESQEIAHPVFEGFAMLSRTDIEENDIMPPCEALELKPFELAICRYRINS